MTSIKDLLEAGDNYISGKSKSGLTVMYSDLAPASINCPKAIIDQHQNKLREMVEMLPELLEILDELTMKQHFGEPAKKMIAKLKVWRDK